MMSEEKEKEVEYCEQLQQGFLVAHCLFWNAFLWRVLIGGQKRLTECPYSEEKRGPGCEILVPSE